MNSVTLPQTGGRFGRRPEQSHTARSTDRRPRGTRAAVHPRSRTAEEAGDRRRPKGHRAFDGGVGPGPPPPPRSRSRHGPPNAALGLRAPAPRPRSKAGTWLWHFTPFHRSRGRAQRGRGRRGHAGGEQRLDVILRIGHLGVCINEISENESAAASASGPLPTLFHYPPLNPPPI